MDDSINNRNYKTTWFNVARDKNINCIICKKPAHVAENCYHLSKAQEEVSKKQNPNLVMQNQQLTRGERQSSLSFLHETCSTEISI